jgi:thiamine biosynthesis lipoprotein
MTATGAPAGGATAAAPPADTLTESFRVMGSAATLTVLRPRPGAGDALSAARAALEQVDAACTRFRPSPLTAANAEPDRWHPVPAALATAVLEARRAHEATDGLFDPRILDVLLAWGHDEALAGGPAAVPAPSWPATLTPSGVRLAADERPWDPTIRQDSAGWWLRLGGQPIDLGGIGKGLAVRAAAKALRQAGRGALVDAGGDLVVIGEGPTGDWRVGVEDPAGGDAPLLVLDLRDSACATSSVRRHEWLAAGESVHHLVDPRTRRPGGDGLAAVTVLGQDPAWAEVWSKALFLVGARHVRARAEDAQLAAAWVGRDGAVGMTEAFAAHVTWRNDD